MKSKLGNIAFAGGVLASALLGVTLQAQAATVIGGSDLLTATYLAQVESWLVNDPQLGYSGSLQFTNIFDKTAGDTATDFHAAVDGHGPTIVVMEATGVSGGTQIIGGFDPQSWSTINDYNLTLVDADRTAFIFNLSTTDRRDQQTASSAGQYQTRNVSSFGPIFGGGYDIFVPTDLTTDGYLYSETYCANSSSTCTGALNLLGLSYTGANVTYGAIEVFTISETSSTPLPAALPLFVTGLGGFGLLGWRRKKKAQASAA